MTRKLLISIHPEHVDKILSGEKRFEYRKKIPSEAVSHIVIYATTPKKRLAAIAEIEYVLEDTPHSLWERTKYASGISRKFFREYFLGKAKGYAFKLGRIWSLDKETAREISHHIPQSFSYFPDADFNFLQEKIDILEHTPSKLVFIAGIHGVGKTSFIQKYLAPGGFQCISSSSVIKDFNGDVAPNKRTNKILENQIKLLYGIAKLRTQNSDIALDGHVTLLNESGIVTRIPQETFFEIKPSHIIVLTAPSKVIKQRLEARDSCFWDLLTIEHFQRQEQQYAVELADVHNIPIDFIDGTLSPRKIVKQLYDFIKTT